MERVGVEVGLRVSGRLEVSDLGTRRWLQLGSWTFYLGVSSSGGFEKCAICWCWIPRLHAFGATSTY